jgi:hypothetical protein
MQRANAGLRERFELMERYLGPINRAGEGFLPPDKANREEKVYRAAGFYGPQRIEVPGHRRAHQRSDRGRHLLALQFDSPLIREPREAFEADPRRLLHDANPAGIFSEQMREVAADIWRPGSPAPAA